MARVLLVYHRAPGMMWRSTYASHLRCLERYSDCECHYLNTSWPLVPGELKRLDYDLIVFHYTFLAVRWTPDEFARQLRRIAFLGAYECPKALVPHDEHIYTDRIREVVNTFGVTHVFTPASEPQWSQIYAGVPFERVRFRTVLTGYLDEESVASTAERSRRLDGRPIDVGYRSWAVYPNFGRHGLLKSEIGRQFRERAPQFGLNADISSNAKDALLGDKWFDFLLDSKYTIGVEGGASILDRDGSARERTLAYTRNHPSAPFEEIEAACFPGRDGELRYRLLGPRHLEAVMTGTCQVLVEGTYGGALDAGTHYIALKEDFSNLDEVLAMMSADTMRAEIVERAYRDIVESGRWTYKALAEVILGDCLPDRTAVGADHRRPVGALTALRRGLREWGLGLLGRCYRLALIVRGRSARSLRQVVQDVLVGVIGEERLWRLTIGLRNAQRRLRGEPPLTGLTYAPTAAEIERRARRARKHGSAGS